MSPATQAPGCLALWVPPGSLVPERATARQRRRASAPTQGNFESTPADNKVPYLHLAYLACNSAAPPTDAACLHNMYLPYPTLLHTRRRIHILILPAPYRSSIHNGRLRAPLTKCKLNTHERLLSRCE